MSDEEFIELDEDEPQEIVHWYDRRPASVTPAEAATVAVGAFALGVLATVGALALAGHLRR